MQTILASNPKLKLVQFYTGFQNYDSFKEVLNLIVPGCDRSQIVYWDKRRSHTYVSGPEYFDSDEDDILDVSHEEDRTPPSRTHKLSVEDEFLLTMMNKVLTTVYTDSYFILAMLHVSYSADVLGLGSDDTALSSLGNKCFTA